MRSNPAHSFVVAVLAAVFLWVASADSNAEPFPDYLPAQYRSYFRHFVDTRSLPERWLNAAGFTSQDFGRSFALVAGVSKYPRMAGQAGTLTPAAEDVRKLIDYLRDYEKIDEIVVLEDADVTQANLSYFLERYFPRRLRQFPKSRFLFAYSGHGTNQNENGYLLTSEATSLSDSYNGISTTTLRAMFQQIIDSGFHVLALINACYSGDFIKRPFGDTHFVPRNSGAHAITAGGTKELTWHDPKVGSGSVFFEKVLAALDGRASTDSIVTVDDLVAYLRREVRISTDQQQNPLSGDLSLHGSLGGFFFFNRRPLIDARVLPTWDPGKGSSFGTAAPAAREAAELFRLAWQYDNGTGGQQKNEQEATRLYKLAADQGHAAAQHNLGVNYRDGLGGLQKDDREAVRLFKLAADQGFAAAQVSLGVIYEEGRGDVRKDEREAARFYKLAADQGNTKAIFNLGVFYDFGRGGLEKNEREAARLYKLAADRGHAGAQHNLGINHRDGLGGLQKNDREAARLFLLAAEQGNADAQLDLGVFYEQGRGGLQKNEREAARLYKLAADRGDAHAQSNLGVFYEQGRGGLQQDEREAARLYRLAADQGDAPGRAFLAEFYESGRGGLQKDMREAMRLYKLAADQGNSYAKKALERIGGRPGGSRR